MVVRLVPGAVAEAACRALVEAHQALTRLPAHGDDEQFFVEYCRWTVDQARILRSLILGHHVDELIFTARHAVLQTIGAGWGAGRAPHLRLLISAEVEERGSALSRAATELRRELDTWSAAGALIVPDTNVFLHHREKFDAIPWSSLVDAAGPVTIVLPIVVIRELDRQKFVGRGKDQRWRAGYSLSRIETLFTGRAIGTESTALNSAAQVHVRVIIDALGHRPLERPDDEIISQALTVQDWAARPVTLATFDTNMAFTARQAGLSVIKMLRTELLPDSKWPEHE